MLPKGPEMGELYVATLDDKAEDESKTVGMARTDACNMTCCNASSAPTTTGGWSWSASCASSLSGTKDPGSCTTKIMPLLAFVVKMAFAVPVSVENLPEGFDLDDVEPQEVEITLYLSLRQRGSWLRSLWAHDLQRMRQVQDFDTFRDSIDHLPSLQETVDQIRDKLPSVTVCSHSKFRV